MVSCPSLSNENGEQKEKERMNNVVDFENVRSNRKRSNSNPGEGSHIQKLRASIFSFLQDRLKKKHGAAKIESLALTVCGNAERSIVGASWSAPPVGSIAEVKRERSLWVPVRILAYITSLADSHLLGIRSDDAGSRPLV